MFPDVAEAMARVLDRQGISLDYPQDQTCCGQPAFNAGYRKEAARAARHFIEVFEEAPAIVCPSGSCVHMVRHHYPELFAKDQAWLERARRVADKTFEFSEFLVDHLQVLDLGAVYSGTATYHDSCHLARGLGVREQPRKLLAEVQGLTLAEMNESDACCGFGGTFAIKYANLSEAIVAEKARNILATGADMVVGCDMGCLMNIKGFLNRMGGGVEVLHLAQVLDTVPARGSES